MWAKGAPHGPTEGIGSASAPGTPGNKGKENVIRVTIRGAPREDGDPCPVFQPAWWHPYDLVKDSRFRVVDPVYYYSVASLNRQEMRELQERFRPHTERVDHWKRDSDQLDRNLTDHANNERWWLVSVYEWESGVE